jgi:uncharacterized Fe-S cluster protein YjdI
MEKKKEYILGDLTVVWKPESCIHSANCVKALPRVFKPKEKPWIQMDNTTVEAVMGAVDKCPSGALSYVRSNKEEVAVSVVENQETVKVTLIDNGPVIVLSALEVTHPDGSVEMKERRASFCRCGKSEKFPYCDGTHKK